MISEAVVVVSSF